MKEKHGHTILLSIPIVQQIPYELCSNQNLFEMRCMEGIAMLRKKQGVS